MAITQVKASAREIQMEIELNRMKEANAKLQAQVMEKQAGRISFKVSQPREAGKYSPTDKGSDGGALSVYGLGRFPITLYKQQWLRLFETIPAMKAFIEEHDSELSVK